MIDVNTINGFFSPLSLSGLETTHSNFWRNSKFSVDNNRQLNVDIKKFNKKDILNNAEVFAELTDGHESDHFHRHTTSELGVLFTTLLLLRHELIKVLLSERKNEICRKILESINRVIYALFISDTELTQQQAVDSLNELYLLLFGIQEKLFIANNPNYPACPSKLFGYSQILETSAILMEIATITTLYRISEETDLNEMLRISHRDPTIYFHLYNFLRNELKFSSLFTIAIIFSLDSRVPVIGSSFDNKVYWEDIHPGYRLWKIASFLKSGCEEHKIFDWNLQGLNMYNYDILEFFYGINKNVCTNFLNYKIWDNAEVIKFKMTADSLIKLFTKEFLDIIRINQQHSISVFNHLFECHNLFKTERTTAYMEFFANSITIKEGQEFSKLKGVKNGKAKEVASAIFAIEGGLFCSKYWDKKTHDIMNAISVECENRCINNLFKGIHPQECYKQIKNIATFQIKEIDEVYNALIVKIICTIYGINIENLYKNKI